MNRQFPVYTIENECQDCYKCVRHCRCKAIKIDNGHAAVIPELCVSCGECVRVCPAHAKKIRSDLSRLRQLLESGEKIYASVAPSFVGFFPGISIEKLAGALKKLGFTGVSETAHGAQLVSAECARLLAGAGNGIYLSSACPAAVDFIRKYHSEFTDSIVPLDSPVISHCKLLKKTFSDNIKCVFIGPCAAKKNEADRMPNELKLAITFQSLQQLLDENEIDLSKVEPAELALGPAEEGRIYSLAGGMNDTLRDESARVRYLTVSGLENLDHILSKLDPGAVKSKIFLEILACDGGCVNGPAMGKNKTTAADVMFATDEISAPRTSVGREVPVNIRQRYFPSLPEKHEISEEDIIRSLGRVGKFSREDELNCGACGYDSCRDFAAALAEGKAEEAMCHNYLRKNFQRTSNALIKYIPAGVVIVDDNLSILESNRHFAELIDQDTLTIYDNLGSLANLRIDSLVDFADLFESVLANGGEIEKFNQPFRDKIINVSVFSITPGKTAGAIVQDVTKPELQREQIAEKARKIIRQNVLTVQQVARLFGEHVAESEILLNEIAGSYAKTASVPIAIPDDQNGEDQQ